MLLIVIALLVFITQWLFYHWWWIIIDAFVATLLVKVRSGWAAFFSGFVGVGLVWLGYIYFINVQNEGLLLYQTQ